MTYQYPRKKTKELGDAVYVILRNIPGRVVAFEAYSSDPAEIERMQIREDAQKKAAMEIVDLVLTGVEEDIN